MSTRIALVPDRGHSALKYARRRRHAASKRPLPAALGLRCPVLLAKGVHPMSTTVTILRHLMIGVGGLTLLATASPLTAQAVTAMSTEAFLNTLGVNTHIDGIALVVDPNQHWDMNFVNVGNHMAYIGVRNQRDWPYKAEEGADFLTVQSNWSPL